MMYLK